MVVKKGKLSAMALGSARGGMPQAKKPNPAPAVREKESPKRYHNKKGKAGLKETSKGTFGVR